MNTKPTKTAIAAILMVSFAAAAGASVGTKTTKPATAKSAASTKPAPAAHSALDAAATAPWTRVVGSDVAATATA